MLNIQLQLLSNRDKLNGIENFHIPTS